LLDTTSQNALPTNQKKARYLQRKAQKLSWYALAIRIWRLRRISRDVEKTLEHVTVATQRKINSALDIGHAKLGDGEMRVEDVLARLEKHEAECSLRYQRIEERLDTQKDTLDRLDYKIWGLAGLIIFAPFVQKFLG